jgi:RNA polymerase sigma factor (sigma-70 family)
VEINDSDIIQQIIAGDKQQYALLMRRYNQRLYRICKGYLDDETEIEDVMQETYVKAYQNLLKFEQRSAFSTWLTRILINECLQRLKLKKRIPIVRNDAKNFDTMNYTDKKSPETESMNTELRQLLESTIAGLPEKYRAVFIMREVEKMSTEETCALLDITESNAKTRLNRAKELLRNALVNVYPSGSLLEFNAVRCDRVAARVMARI